jgi:hypothetical protein
MYHSITIHKQLSILGVHATFPKQRAYTCKCVTETDITGLNAAIQQLFNSASSGKLHMSAASRFPAGGSLLYADRCHFISIRTWKDTNRALSAHIAEVVPRRIRYFSHIRLLISFQAINLRIYITNFQLGNQSISRRNEVSAIN